MKKNNKSIRVNMKSSVGSSAPLSRGGRKAAYFEAAASPLQRRYPGSIRIRGQDYLGPVNAPTGGDNNTGKVLENLFISPEEFAGTRLAQFGTLYEKYLFRKLRFHWQPVQPATQKGSLILAYDRDISDPTPAGFLNAVRELLSFDGAKSFSIWEECVIDCPLEQPDSGYYTNQVSGDERLAYQGQLYVATLNPSALSAGNSMGDLWVEYELDLFVPQLSNPTSTLTVGASASTPTVADALLQYVGKNPPAASNAAWVPKSVQGLTNSVMELNEGLYRFTNTIIQGAAGALTFNPPQLQLKDPSAVISAPAGADAPGGWTKAMNLLSSTATGQPAQWDGLIDVPRGGGYVTQSFSTGTGIGVAPTSNLDFIKIAPYTGSLGAYF